MARGRPSSTGREPVQVGQDAGPVPPPEHGPPGHAPLAVLGRRHPRRSPGVGRRRDRSTARRGPAAICSVMNRSRISWIRLPLSSGSISSLPFRVLDHLHAEQVLHEKGVGAHGPGLQPGGRGGTGRREIGQRQAGQVAVETGEVVAAPAPRQLHPDAGARDRRR